MPRYEHVDYNSVADTALVAAKILGEPVRLKEIVDRISRDKNWGLDPVRVMRILEPTGKVVEHIDEYPIYDLRGNIETIVKKVTVWVKP